VLAVTGALAFLTAYREVHGGENRDHDEGSPLGYLHRTGIDELHSREQLCHVGSDQQRSAKRVGQVSSAEDSDYPVNDKRLPKGAGHQLSLRGLHRQVLFKMGKAAEIQSEWISHHQVWREKRSC